MLPPVPDGRRPPAPVGALEPKFLRLCDSRRDLPRDSTTPIKTPTADSRDLRDTPLADWLAHFGDEDVCVGPVWTREEAGAAFGSLTAPEPVPLGAHTDAWRRELGL